MLVNRKDIGYTIYSRVEETLRYFIKDNLLTNYGSEWKQFVPKGILDKTIEKLPSMYLAEVDDPLIILDESDLPDLTEIICYKNGYSNFISKNIISMSDFQEKMTKLYNIRCKIAHVKSTFSAIDLDVLIEISKSFLLILRGVYKDDLESLLNSLSTNPSKVILQIPATFYINDDKPLFNHINNLSPIDYDTDGGFIGRKEDIEKILKHLINNLDRVVTIIGAGGVGKTAIAHQICCHLLSKTNLPFDAIVWVSAKEEKLTITGIEHIEPTLRNYESLLDSILETFGWYDSINAPIDVKEEDVNIILGAGENGILLVVDNLETIQDERVIEFIKDIPQPSKVLITSRVGLGEIERRYPLKEMNSKDAIVLLRTIAREKGAETLSRLPDDILSKYVEKMSKYPLAIKWVIGQVALGKDIDNTINNLTSPDGDVAKFCFEHIFNSLLTDDDRRVLYSLAASDEVLVRGVLTHISNLSSENLDASLRRLTIASLVIPTQTKTLDNTIETKYELLPLTKNYIHSKLKSNTEIHREIKQRTILVQNLIEEADRAGKQYRYSLHDMGAETIEEKVAATWAITAFQKYQSGDYDGSVETYNKAVQIAPNFPAVYRNWASMECDAGFYEKADELMDKATKLDPNDSRLWFVWGNIEKRRQRYEKAYNYLNKALSLAPNDAPILGAIGEVEKRRGNFEEADILLRKALNSASSSSSRKNEIISKAAIADNCRRWSEFLLKDKQIDNALKKMKEAFSLAYNAYELDKNNVRTQDTFLDVAKDLAILVLKEQGLYNSLPYFFNSIITTPKRANERKVNSTSCLYLSKALLKNGHYEEAKKYFNLGKKCLFPDSNLWGKYRELGSEFVQERYEGKLVNVNINRGYGIILPKYETGETIFLHISEVFPKLSNEDFKALEGTTLNYKTLNIQGRITAKCACTNKLIDFNEYLKKTVI